MSAPPSSSCLTAPTQQPYYELPLLTSQRLAQGETKVAPEFCYGRNHAKGQ